MDHYVTLNIMSYHQMQISTKPIDSSHRCDYSVRHRNASRNRIKSLLMKTAQFSTDSKEHLFKYRTHIKFFSQTARIAFSLHLMKTRLECVAQLKTSYFNDRYDIFSFFSIENSNYILKSNLKTFHKFVCVKRRFERVTFKDYYPC